jgi:hypothetical protein
MARFRQLESLFSNPFFSSRSGVNFADPSEGTGPPLRTGEWGGRIMTIRQGRWIVAGLLGLALGLSTGCQTWVPEAAMTLPSPNYLLHPPQYIRPSPDYPLPRELKSLTDAAAAQQNALRQPAGF